MLRILANKLSHVACKRANSVPTTCQLCALLADRRSAERRGAAASLQPLSPVSSSTRPYALSKSRLTSARCLASSLTSPFSWPRARWI